MNWYHYSANDFASQVTTFGVSLPKASGFSTCEEKAFAE
jgi:hypothetical protein